MPGILLVLYVNCIIIILEPTHHPRCIRSMSDKDYSIPEGEELRTALSSQTSSKWSLPLPLAIRSYHRLSSASHPDFCSQRVNERMMYAACPRCYHGSAVTSRIQKYCILQVPFWKQRAAQGHDSELPLVWDYHVILLEKQGSGTTLIWDLDR